MKTTTFSAILALALGFSLSAQAALGLSGARSTAAQVSVIQVSAGENEGSEGSEGGDSDDGKAGTSTGTSTGTTTGTTGRGGRGPGGRGGRRG